MNLHYDQLRFGVKIGYKIENKGIRWLEKWAEFHLPNDETLKYFCKFWYHGLNEIHSEVKL